jgi:hypothetical protein
MATVAAAVSALARILTRETVCSVPETGLSGRGIELVVIFDGRDGGFSAALGRAIDALAGGTRSGGRGRSASCLTTHMPAASAPTSSHLSFGSFHPAMPQP